jgi:hypothetical protein
MAEPLGFFTSVPEDQFDSRSELIRH